jgi:hypothetical protein
MSIMIDRNLRIAVCISVGVHIFAMSAVMIVVPNDIGRNKSFTRVDFLGPILEKTAFDIMLESANPVVKTSYGWGMLPESPEDLGVSSPGRISFEQDLPAGFENSLDRAIIDALSDYKSVPDFFLDVRDERMNRLGWRAGERRIIYTSEQPYIMKGLYGDKEIIRIKVRALVSSRGEVKKTEPVTTTGYPQLDMLAAKYVRSWIFEAREEGVDEWVLLEVKLNTGD